MAKEDNSYCDITFAQITIDYNIPDNFDDEEYDQEYTLAVNGCSYDKHISLEMCSAMKGFDSLEITFDHRAARQIINAIEAIIKEQG